MGHGEYENKQDSRLIRDHQKLEVWVVWVSDPSLGLGLETDPRSPDLTLSTSSKFFTSNTLHLFHILSCQSDLGINSSVRELPSQMK